MSDAMLQGTWHVVTTSLGMWQRRSRPSITYAPLPDGRISDTVLSQGRRGWSVISGIDEQQPDGSFVWRGVQPLTLLVRSRWRVLLHDEPFAAISFARTPFTAAGVDVLARDPEAEPDAVAVVVERLRADAEAAPFLDRLRPPLGRG
jgi:histidinol-phosphatase (PHP family)